MTPIDTTFTTRRSRFDYGIGGDATSLTFDYPARAWEQREETIGGRRIAAGGLGASFIVRTDTIILLPLRFKENDYPSVLDMIAWGQSEESMTWYPDVDDLVTSFVVWLHSPPAGVPVRPVRMAEYPKMLELSIELRRRDLPETPWNLDYYGP